jgi:hypothetical protein
MSKPHSLSWNDWKEYLRVLQNQNRFFVERDCGQFLQTVLATVSHRRKILRAEETCLYRARRDHVQDDEGPQPCDFSGLAAPTTDKVRRGGRANPSYVSYFYASNDPLTAISEVKPSLDEFVSVGAFRLIGDVEVVDVSCDKQTLRLLSTGDSKPSQESCETHMWGEINHAFSVPIRTGDDEEVRDYLPTQSLAEWFKINGFDGVVYKSAFTSEGQNIVLFDPKKVEGVSRRLWFVDRIEIKASVTCFPEVLPR